VRVQREHGFAVAIVIGAVLVAATAAGAALVGSSAPPAPVATATPTTEPPKLESASTVSNDAAADASTEDSTTTVATSVEDSTTYPEGALGAVPSGQAPTTRKGQQPSRPINVPLGELVCPMGGPFWHSDDWLAPRSGGRVHLGNDLIAEEGIPVRSISDGYVFRVDRVNSFDGGHEDLGGITITILTVAGDRFYYAHLATVEPIVVPGSPVNAGEVLGLVGQTGNAAYSVPHLHLEWRPGGGVHANPYPFVEQLCGPHPRSTYVPLFTTTSVRAATTRTTAKPTTTTAHATTAATTIPTS